MSDINNRLHFVLLRDIRRCLDPLRLSIGRGWDVWSTDELMTMLRLCEEIERTAEKKDKTEVLNNG